ncbi:hypothetical protein ACLOJK_027863 [Asimina triloba]
MGLKYQVLTQEVVRCECEGGLTWWAIVAATTTVGGRTKAKKSHVEVSGLLSEVGAILDVSGQLFREIVKEERTSFSIPRKDGSFLLRPAGSKYGSVWPAWPNELLPPRHYSSSLQLSLSHSSPF